MGAIYLQLSIEERRSVERWRLALVPVREIARVLKRLTATIHREIKASFSISPKEEKQHGMVGEKQKRISWLKRPLCPATCSLPS